MVAAPGFEHDVGDGLYRDRAFQVLFCNSDNDFTGLLFGGVK